jgi:hypothetical protein
VAAALDFPREAENEGRTLRASPEAPTEAGRADPRWERWGQALSYRRARVCYILKVTTAYHREYEETLHTISHGEDPRPT